MERERAQAVIEAVLFAMGDSVSIADLAIAVDESEKFVKEILEEMKVFYAESNRGIQIVELEDAVQLRTKDEFYEELIKVAAAPKKQTLTDALLETLSIIAYKQPITRSEIEAERGISSDYAISTLLNLNMIEPCGRKDTPGKPILYATTDNFLKRFKLKALSELPDYEEMMRRIAALSAAESANNTSSYLYEKDVYDPDADPELMEDLENDVNDVKSEGKTTEGNSFEFPDFLKDIEDGIIKIQ